MPDKDMPDETQITDEWLYQILEKVKSGDLPVKQALEELRILPYEKLGFANIDHHRSLRLGFPEVIFGQGKTGEQIIAITERLLKSSKKLLITHVSAEVFNELKAKVADAIYNPASRTITVDRSKNRRPEPGVTVVTGGTSDIAVAEEAAVTAELMGNKVERYFDIGVAGLHRTLDRLPALRKAKVENKEGLLKAGMGKGPALSLLLAGPALSLPNMLVIRSVMGTKRTLVFVVSVIVLSTVAGLIYGAMS